ncbi:MAG: hypothetical protein Q9219_002710 [cf. Caloplaca sp. 3 TL-2023]
MYYAAQDHGGIPSSPGEHEYPDPDAVSIHHWSKETYNVKFSNKRNEDYKSPIIASDSSSSSQVNYELGTDMLNSNISATNDWPSISGKPDQQPHSKGSYIRKSSSREESRRFRKGIKRGLRRPLEPSNEFKALHTQATAAFIDSDYTTAEQLTLQAILMNPEMYAAHSLLSEIHSARGEHDKAFTALFNGAHTRPRDTEAWDTLAQMLLARSKDDDTVLTDALYCYSRIIQVDPQNVHARLQRATLNRRLGYMGRAAAEYEHLFRIFPDDLSILRSLAEIYTGTDKADRATEHYDACIKSYQAREPEKPKTLTWSDVNIYVELLADQQRYIDGIAKIKSLSRWLLGRRWDNIWENQTDDREWDIDDYPRRHLVEGFRVGSYADTSYGKGLPLELHVKLGTYRLRHDKQQIQEASRHFELLEPGNASSDARLFRYPDLFREAADALCNVGFYQEALRYYAPLLLVMDFVDTSCYVAMAFCYKSIGLQAEAENCYRSIADLERKHPTTRVRLSPDAHDGALIRGRIALPGEGIESGASDSVGVSRATAPSAMLLTRLSKNSLKRRDPEKRSWAQLHDEKIYTLYGRTQLLLGKVRNGDTEALLHWKAAAQELVEDFRSHRQFFPRDRSLRTWGKTTTSAVEALKDQVDQAMQDIVGQVRAHFSKVALINDVSPLAELILRLDDLYSDPLVTAGDFRGIQFTAWLDLILEYATLLAQSKDFRRAYEMIGIANSANVFISSPSSIFLIHVCWFTCALLVNDEETLCSVARWFMKEFQFITDGYWLFCTLDRLCDDKKAWFNCGPTQKFVRRQLKAMDYSLVEPSQQRRLYQEKASYTTKDDEGRPISAGDMDLSLLMLYGYMLYLGKSFALSLNYFFRAFALDPGNPTINLTLSLAYVQHAIKRQSANRDYLITQGLTFLFRYYDIRSVSQTRSERQEAEFNVARTYHMLGLTHLAIPYYEKCICCNYGSPRIDTNQGPAISAEAAFALRTIWAANNEMGKAAGVTRKYLFV